MQVLNVTFNRESESRRAEQRQSGAVSWLTRIFGCWHQEMSRPFTLHAESYRVCLECGAHRRFNPHTWEMTGPYYYESAASLEALYGNLNVETIKVAPVRRNQTPLLRAAA